jgi:GTPase KRas protein
LLNNEISRSKEDENVPKVLLGNKVDLEVYRQIGTLEGMELAKKWKNCGFFEMSAKNRVNIEESFNDIVKRIVKHLKEAKKPKEKKKSV